jgi:hypothetical protein
MKDILETVEGYISEDNPHKWAKLSSTIQYRRFVLTLLREILKELRKSDKKMTK